ncbi:DUF1439 domain-containing protein [Testudinibacter aquarius]|uniref:DUF1439 domain-containing protein n=1 Tax=Testudinibacter aquarius TaxID=1524974 RepID=A0A4R3YDK1_9PAST|nr:DUF1439 domain-containing protein [Testudinibacter aquarius]KAE9527455.1 hypothetical protein A1D24_02110 [Testudinibacter aquarius]TCV89981.1 uncharacterized protein DUF1439 [Testudinibacter aquarius]TNG93010.1 DUF1439 domain-containing protein [Testudinibacter aquarius]
MLQMPVIRVLFMLLFMLPFALPLSANANNIEISEAQINHYLSRKLGFNDQFNLPGIINIRYKVDQMQANVGRNNSNKIELDGVVSAAFSYNNRQFDSRINLVFDVEPEYNAEQGAVYLKNLRMLRWSSQPQKYADQLQLIMPMLNNTVQTLLNQFPVYTLDSNDATQNMIKQMVKKLRVSDGKIVLETSALL